MKQNEQGKQNIIVIANDIRSLHNVGSIFRSCDAFGVEKLYLVGITGVPPRKEITKVSLGSERRVDWEYRAKIDELLNELHNSCVELVGLETGSSSLPIDSFEPKRAFALVVGNEVDGLCDDLIVQLDFTLEIPMRGGKRSLNVSVATGIALFALTRKKI